MKYKSIQLKEIADIIMGQSPKSIFYNNSGIGLPFLQGVRTFGEDYPKIDTYTTRFKTIANQGDILFSVRAPVGKINWANQEISLGRGLACIRVKPGYSKEYLYYYLKKIGTSINSLANGTVFTSINKKELEEIEIKIPINLNDQRNIANPLKTLDSKLMINNQINDNLLELANVIFTKQINKDTTKLSNIATIQNGYAFKSKEYVAQKQLLILRTKNIGSNHLFNKFDVVYIDQDNFNEYQKFAFKKFDTVLVMVGASIGKTGFITSNVLPSLQNQNMWRFRVKNSRMPGLLLYEYVNYINKRVKGSASGSARSFYRKELFNDFEVPIIDNNIFTVFERIQLQINNIQVENNVLSKLRQELLNKYF